ncbi:hypothetical protein LJC68_10065 [Bacteroidales bacterium OttesenSCG-928-B11]|nr:hypothetical protein [Bacteroidales bacterium OttesenSCG-928-C03]MDL2313205.1 hypothetical protein [Bacteroidales bacterium OttesenSCG-928-B11]MDL2326129.1 hypothetical protein [Bacteroidales bacterium OttesenSCG-928-A14]
MEKTNDTTATKKSVKTAKSKKTAKTTKTTQTAQATQTINAPLTGFAAHRVRLKEVSEQAKELKAHYENPDSEYNKTSKRPFKDHPLNYYIMTYIYGVGSSEFKTLEEWNEIGAKVKKGSKAFPIWGKPIETENGVFFPILFVFNLKQVEFKKEA